ncbi:MAG: proline iminopeptidase-family hydrolase [Pseudomonadota bacterium]
MPFKDLSLDRRAFFAGLASAALAPSLANAKTAWTAPAPERELMVPVRGGRIYVRVNGDLKGPKAPVICAHGGPGGTHAYFLPSLQMATDRAVILYDQLDTGLSDRPNDPANWTVERSVSEVDAIRAALDVPKLHFVGHSWGSTIALEYAARQPGGLKSVVMGSPLLSTKSWTQSTLAQLAKLPPEVVETINTLEAAGDTANPAYDKAMAIFYRQYAGRAPAPAYIAEYAKAKGLKGNSTLYNGMWGPGEIRATGSLKTYDGEPLLPRVTAPALVITGEYDEMTADVLKPLVARMPAGELVVVPDAGHGMPATHAEPYIAAVRAHLAKND